MRTCRDGRSHSILLQQFSGFKAYIFVDPTMTSSQRSLTCASPHSRTFWPWRGGGEHHEPSAREGTLAVNGMHSAAGGVTMIVLLDRHVCVVVVVSHMPLHFVRRHACTVEHNSQARACICRMHAGQAACRAKRGSKDGSSWSGDTGTAMGGMLR